MNEPHYRAVIISPHLDDAVFSCGGLIARLTGEGPVLVLNLFTRYSKEVKTKGVVLGAHRYEEELEAAQFLGFETRNLGELDATFRREAYHMLGNIFHPPVPADCAWLSELKAKIFETLEKIDFESLYVPMGVGWHVDHILAHLVFESYSRHQDVIYYEEVPYCTIPHATRHRLDGIAEFPRDARDRSLVKTPRLRAWWETSAHYSRTALMRNLKPWIVRIFAVPVVSYYFFRLVMIQRKHAKKRKNKYRLEPVIEFIGDRFERKLTAMALYRSQYKEFFTSREDCESTLLRYADRIQAGTGPLERYWKVRER